MAPDPERATGVTEEESVPVDLAARARDPADADARDARAHGERHPVPLGQRAGVPCHRVPGHPDLGCRQSLAERLEQVEPGLMMLRQRAQPERHALQRPGADRQLRGGLGHARHQGRRQVTLESAESGNGGDVGRLR